MRKHYNSARFTLPFSRQQRVGLIHTGAKKISDYCLALILLIAGLAWIPASATNVAIHSGRPTAGTVSTWITANGSPTGADGSYASGNTITYSIYVQNNGATAITNVTVVDTLPANTSFYGATYSVTPDANGKITWTIPSIAAGATAFVNLTVTVGSNLSGVAYIKNTAYVDAGDGNGLLPTPATQGGTYTSWPALSTPVDNGANSIAWLSVSSSSSAGTVTAGDVLTYTVHIRNKGTVDLTNLVIYAYVPAYTIFVDGDNSVTADANGLVTWTIPSLPVGSADVTRAYRVKVSTDLTGASAITNTAYVDNGNGKGKIATYPAATGDASNPNSASNAGVSTSISVSKSSSFDTWMIVLNENGNNYVSSSDVLTYYIYTRNTGSVTIPTVQINVVVPTGTDYTQGYDGATHPLNTDVQTVYWTVSNLVAGAISTVRYTVTAYEDLTSYQAITSTATVNNGDTIKNTMNCDPNESGCDGKTVTSISVQGGKPGLFVSNVVTPNGDGKNDYFYIRNLDEYQNSKLYIFNRWGAQIYYSNNYQNDWKGTGLAEGTYYYKIELHTGTNPDQYTTYKGWVMIIR
ncbi:gliding motility-associated C-terminal domain-containing protein [Chitinophaga sp.]|uniref:T9SS type B sorting domain-containing protein n=1 Tax=Chitinophaga sp. TaxID=1869181 RepID=UPI0031CFC508